jgi:hypothetical protein
MSDLDLIMKAEDGGVDTEEEFLALADAVYRTGLHRSTGSYGRLLESAHTNYGWEPPTS